LHLGQRLANFNIRGSPRRASNRITSPFGGRPSSTRLQTSRTRNPHARVIGENTRGSSEISRERGGGGRETRARFSFKGRTKTGRRRVSGGKPRKRPPHGGRASSRRRGKRKRQRVDAFRSFGTWTSVALEETRSRGRAFVSPIMTRWFPFSLLFPLFLRGAALLFPVSDSSPNGSLTLVIVSVAMRALCLAKPRLVGARGRGFSKCLANRAPVMKEMWSREGEI